MDVLQYPGDEVMQDWWSNSPLYYTGFYLAPAPYQSYTGWMNKRETLVNQGWGFLPLYVGRQSDSSYLTAEQGKIDAQDAATLASNAGFPSLSYIYLDIEQGGIISSKFIDYIKAWVSEINTNTSYWSGIYCSYSDTADQIKTAIGSTTCRFWVFNLNYTGTPGSGTAPDPTNSGVSFATTWQLEQNISKTYGSNTRTIDVDTSSLIDPSK
ncbi:MAG: pSRTUE45c [Clostridia bacterium]|jgi:hypothetical protein|nr:pSRTUE45c [Clostridia bacterium]